MDCLFCKIASHEIPSTILYEDDLVCAFKDVSPQAPTHFLVVPKTHIASLDEIREENSAVIAHIFTVIAKLCKQQGLTDGYRVVSNCGKDGGQTVGHLHFHVLGGRSLAWPPG